MSVIDLLTGFNPRLPGGRRPGSRNRYAAPYRRFNPRLPGGRRLISAVTTLYRNSFNPRLPGGRRPGAAGAGARPSAVSIHAFRGEGDKPHFRIVRAAGVSIHAFRGEGDPGARRSRVAAGVSIHAFRGEGDKRCASLTSPKRRFNPRLPGGRRPGAAGAGARPSAVSIHAFRGEGDRKPTALRY